MKEEYEMGSQKKKEISITLGAVALLIALALLVGFRTEGVSTDEDRERVSSLVNYKYLVPSVENIVTDSVDFASISDLSEWQDRAYGVTLQLPTVVIEHLFDFQMDLAAVFQIRHVYTFLLFALAAVFFYFLCRRLFDNRWYALLGLALFVVCPRILTEAFYNIKDLLFLSIFTINLFCCILFMEKRTIGRALGLMATTALCVNTRVVGAVAIVFCFAVLGIQHIRKRASVKEYFWLAATGLGSIVLYIAATPFLWADPVGGIKEILATFSDFTRFGGDVYYMGNIFSSADLPWHYLPVCILATIPVAYSLLAAVGTVHRLCLFKRNATVQVFLMLTLLFTLLFPVLYSVLRRPTLYNMWRHMYFLYPLLVIQAVNGFCYLMAGKKWIQRGAQVLTALSLCFTSFWLIKNSPMAMYTLIQLQK